MPVIASLNGITPGGWVGHAKRMRDAGADALELNLYTVATDPRVGAAELEARYLDLVADVRSAVSIPLAVKLSPFYTALANFAVRVDAGRRRRAGPVQPLLPARPGSRQPRRGAQAGAVDL